MVSCLGIGWTIFLLLLFKKIMKAQQWFRSPPPPGKPHTWGILWPFLIYNWPSKPYAIPRSYLGSEHWQPSWKLSQHSPLGEPLPPSTSRAHSGFLNLGWHSLSNTALTFYASASDWLTCSGPLNPWLFVFIRVHPLLKRKWWGRSADHCMSNLWALSKLRTGLTSGSPSKKESVRASMYSCYRKQAETVACATQC